MMLLVFLWLMYAKRTGRVHANTLRTNNRPVATIPESELVKVDDGLEEVDAENPDTYPDVPTSSLITTEAPPPSPIIKEEAVYPAVTTNAP